MFAHRQEMVSVDGDFTQIPYATGANSLSSFTHSRLTLGSAGIGATVTVQSESILCELVAS
jgi:hypothetical protein